MSSLHRSNGATAGVPVAILVRYKTAEREESAPWWLVLLGYPWCGCAIWILSHLGYKGRFARLCGTEQSPKVGWALYGLEIEKLRRVAMQMSLFFSACIADTPEFTLSLVMNSFWVLGPSYFTALFYTYTVRKNMPISPNWEPDIL